MHNIQRKAFVAVALGAGLLASGLATQASAGPSFPGSYSLVATSDRVTGYRWGSPDSPVSVDLGVFLTAEGRGFEIRVGHQRYQDPVTATFTERAGKKSRKRDLPAGLQVAGSGLRNFATLTITGADGAFVSSTPLDFCPNGYNPQRAAIDGPDQSPYPTGCSPNPFTFWTILGLAQGWGASVSSFDYRFDPDQPVMADGEYTYVLAVEDAWADFLGIETRSATVNVTVITQTDGEGIAEAAPAAGARRAEAPLVPAEAAERLGSKPDPKTLPDLRSLPAFGIAANNDPESGRDLLAFAANEWNAGPGPLVVDGIRNPARPGQLTAYQRLYKDGKIINTVKTGSLAYHEGGGHDHWHFQDFARYELTDSSKKVVQRSGKEAWCLAPTDAIDLTVPGAVWQPYSSGPTTNCGGGSANALSIREVMPAGWGDTYSQWVAGQAFDITDLPNGTYYIKVTANPDGRLYEVSQDNNTSFRKVIVAGQPGARTVEVPPYEGIDSEAMFRSGAAAMTGFGVDPGGHARSAAAAAGHDHGAPDHGH